MRSDSDKSFLTVLKIQKCVICVKHDVMIY